MKKPSVLVDEQREAETTDSVDALEHANAEIQASNVHRICSFPFPRSHIRMGLGLARRTGSGGCRSINRRVNIISNELILHRSVRKVPVVKVVGEKDRQ